MNWLSGYIEVTKGMTKVAKTDNMSFEMACKYLPELRLKYPKPEYLITYNPSAIAMD